MKQQIWRTFKVSGSSVYEWQITEIDPATVSKWFLADCLPCRDGSYIHLAFFTFRAKENFEAVRKTDAFWNDYFKLEVIDV